MADWREASDAAARYAETTPLDWGLITTGMDRGFRSRRRQRRQRIAAAGLAGTAAALTVFVLALPAESPQVDPARPPVGKLDIDSAERICAAEPPNVKPKDVGFSTATFADSVMRMENGDTVPNPDPFPGTVVLPGSPRYCFFAPVSRTRENLEYWMTVINPEVDLRPGTYDGSVSSGVLYAGKREGKYLYVGVFYFPDGLRSPADYFRDLRGDDNDTLLVESFASGEGAVDAGRSFDPPYVQVLFSSPTALNPDDTIGLMPKPGEPPLDWLKSPQYLVVADALPLPTAQPEPIDLRKKTAEKRG